MKSCHPLLKVVCFALSFLTFPAYAQWNGSIGLGARHAELIERDRTGDKIVSEKGWLPGIELAARYHSDAWRMKIEVDHFSSRIDYKGQLQNGTPYNTHTRSEQTRVRTMILPRIMQNFSFVAGLEWQRWNRDIQGSGAVLGLDERYDNWRLLAGAEYEWNIAGCSLQANTMLVRARPEKMRIRFQNGIYDTAELQTKPATGLRIGLAAKSMRWPSLSLSVNYDWIKIRRSDAYELRRNGFIVGTVAQPEHVQQTFTVMLAHVF